MLRADGDTLLPLEPTPNSPPVTGEDQERSPVAMSFRSYNPRQVLLPPPPDEWLPERHLAPFVSELVEVPDLSAIPGCTLAPAEPPS